MAKISTLDAMVREHVRDGDTLFVGGFGQNVPFAIGAEIVRQRRRDLTLCRTGADILFDIMIAAGVARKVIVGWIGNPGIGLNHAFTRALRDGKIQIEESSNFAVLLRLMAGGLGIPFMPTRTLAGGDVPARLKSVLPMRCPFTDESLMAVRALVPDVAIVHVQRADPEGNLQSWGVLGDTLEGAAAARKVIATVEEIVETGVIREAPEKTIIPGWRVEAVSRVEFGAYPSYSQDYYDRDDDFYRNYDRLARQAPDLERWIDEHIHGTATWEECLRLAAPGLAEPARRARRAPDSGRVA